MLFALGQTDLMRFILVAVFILFAEIDLHVHVDPAQHIDDLDDAGEGDPGIVVDVDVQEIFHGLDGGVHAVKAGMGQLVQAEAAAFIGLVWDVGIPGQRDHGHMVRLRVDHEQEIDIAAQLLIRRSHFVDAADVEDEAVLGHVLVAGILPGPRVSICLQRDEI